MRVFIDAGHNFSGCDTGATGNGLREQDITFKIADKLRVLLSENGHDVKMSRSFLSDSLGSTTSESLKLRCKMSNDWGADLFVSIHCNAGGGKGTETLVFSKGSSACDVAERVQAAVTKRLGMVDRGVKERSDLYVLKNTAAPAILVETGFIDCDSDRQKLSTRQAEFAEAIYEGVTGEMAEIRELTEVNDIVWELCERKIITDKELWLSKLKTDNNAYFLARKAVHYMRGRDV